MSKRLNGDIVNYMSHHTLLQAGRDSESLVDLESVPAGRWWTFRFISPATRYLDVNASVAITPILP